MDDADPVEMVREHFDAFADGEWQRLVQSPRTKVSLELHHRMLWRFVGAGDRVLEVGAGPGRFTTALAEVGATVVVSDVSPVQLGLNEEKVRKAGWEGAVEDRLLVDVRDLSVFDDASFDAVVAYGGPLSYAFERAEDAFAECLRVTRPGGVVLSSVMTTIGTMRLFLGNVIEEIEAFGIDVTDKVISTGDLRHTPYAAHRCRLFRWRELSEMIDRLPCTLVAASASNAASTGDPDALARLHEDPDRWRRFLDWEEELGQEPGSLDGGTHTIFVVRRT